MTTTYCRISGSLIEDCESVGDYLSDVERKRIRSLMTELDRELSPRVASLSELALLKKYFALGWMAAHFVEENK